MRVERLKKNYKKKLPLEMTYSAIDYENDNRYDGEYELPRGLTVAILQHQTQTLPDS
jgi:hypothetical protein